MVRQVSINSEINLGTECLIAYRFLFQQLLMDWKFQNGVHYIIQFWRKYRPMGVLISGLRLLKKAARLWKTSVTTFTNMV